MACQEGPAVPYLHWRLVPLPGIAAYIDHTLEDESKQFSARRALRVSTPEPEPRDSRRFVKLLSELHGRLDLLVHAPESPEPESQPSSPARAPR